MSPNSSILAYIFQKFPRVGHAPRPQHAKHVQSTPLPKRLVLGVWQLCRHNFGHNRYVCESGIMLAF